MKLRTMQELESDMTQHEINRMASLTARAIEANNADDAAQFARSAVRVARQLDADEHGAELVAEPSLRLVAPNYVAEIRRAYSDDAVLLPDMLGELEAVSVNPELWLNNTDPDLDAIGRYADPLHDECGGMGVLRECDEWAFCSCTKAALLAAAEEPGFASVVRLLTTQQGCQNAREFFIEPLRMAA